MSLPTQAFIREHGLDELARRYAITVKRHGEFPNLCFLKYNQIESPMAEPIVQECRGLILDEADNWRVVSYPFRKFFNYGEGQAADIDWRTARVYEKLDGSLMTLYWYRGGWRVASNGLPDASGPVYGYSGAKTFAELFWRTWDELGYRRPPKNLSDYCFMFELMTPHNRVVVPHAESRLILIGVRGGIGCAERRPELWSEIYGWKCVRSFPLTCIGDCLAAAEKLNPMESEGYVVCDANFNRIKVKSPQYVALAHMKDQFSARRMLEVVRANESDEFLTYFPEMRPLYEQVKARFDDLCDGLEACWSEIRGITDRKLFAQQATVLPMPAALFALLDGKAATVREFMAKAALPSLERVVLAGLDAQPVAATSL